MALLDQFDDVEKTRRVFHRLAAKGIEIPPAELANQIRGFLQRVQDELTAEGVWWSMDELIAYCEKPVVIAAIKALARLRGNAGWQEFVDTITSLERGKVQP